MWRPQLPALAAAGYRAVAPSQRGYSPGARPDAADAANYRFDRLVADAIDVVWGDADDTVRRVAAEGTRELVSSPYASEILRGIGHFAVEQAPQRTKELLLAYLAEHPA
jgi:pimeloyl-ACP methyl ester carboxylesterase